MSDGLFSRRHGARLRNDSSSSRMSIFLTGLRNVLLFNVALFGSISCGGDRGFLCYSGLEEAQVKQVKTRRTLTLSTLLMIIFCPSAVSYSPVSECVLGRTARSCSYKASGVVPWRSVGHDLSITKSVFQLQHLSSKSSARSLYHNRLSLFRTTRSHFGFCDLSGCSVLLHRHRQVA